MVEIGIVGTGALARAYVRACVERPDVESSVVAGQTARGTDDAVTEHDTVEALATSGPAMAIVCSPPTERRSDIERLTDGIDRVVCPGPLADSVGDAEAIAATATESTSVLVPVHAGRTAPPSVTAARRIAEGTIGAVGTVRTFRQLVTPASLVCSDPVDDLVFGIGFHELDFCRWLCGPIERVFARPVRGAGLSAAIVTLRCGPTVGHIEIRRTAREGFESARRFELAGTGILSYDSQQSPPIALTPSARESPFDSYRAGPDRVLSQLLAEDSTDDSPTVSIPASLATLRATLAVLESIETGQPVALDRPA